MYLFNTQWPLPINKKSTPNRLQTVEMTTIKKTTLLLLSWFCTNSLICLGFMVKKVKMLNPIQSKLKLFQVIMSRVINSIFILSWDSSKKTRRLITKTNNNLLRAGILLNLLIEEFFFNTLEMIDRVSDYTLLGVHWISTKIGQ